MYYRKAVHAILAVLILFVLVNPALALPTPDQTPTQPTTGDTQPTQNQLNSAETTATSGLEQALTEAEMAVRQTQAERIRQELDSLGDELERLNTDYFAESAKLASIEASLNDSKERLRWFEAEYDAQRTILNDRISNIYKHGNVEPLDAIVDNASFGEIYTRLSMLLKIGEQDAELLQKLREQKEKVENTKVALDQLYAQQKQITADLEGRKKAIEAKVQEEQTLLANIDSQTKAILEQQVAQQQQEQAKLVTKLAQEAQKDEPQKINQETTKNDKINLAPGSIGFEAIQYLGVPYVWGGEDPKIGLDCSGLVKVVFKNFGIDLVHFARSQANVGAPVAYDELQSGDLIFFGSPIHHVGIYLGEGYYIHAPKRNDFVKISRLSDRSDFTCARRIISVLPSN